MWQVFTTTFISIFLAELGDKTQLAVFSLGAGNAKLTVFIAASLALVLSTALAVLAGEFVSKFVPTLWLNRGAGAVFIILGFYYLKSR